MDERSDYETNMVIQAMIGSVTKAVRNVDLAAPLLHDTSESPLDSCVICADDRAEVLLKGVRRTTCGHDFCRRCLEEWLSRNVSCPICKHDLSVEGGSHFLEETPSYSADAGRLWDLTEPDFPLLEPAGASAAEMLLAYGGPISAHQFRSAPLRSANHALLIYHTERVIRISIIDAL